MDQDIRLGRIAGIPIGVNWSLLLIFVLITWELADLILPGYHPHDAVAIYWLVGSATSIMFFVSLLAHELSHAVLAKRNGIGVRRITFWLFGGVSELESEALTPSADLQIAAVGPLTSLALGLVFGILALAVDQIVGAGVEVSALGWLAWMNVLLSVFNLVPAAPLDGGRVLRAVLWRRSGDRLGATTTAARSGEAFAYVLITLGILEFLAVGLIGLWFVFLGWFLLTAARTEQSSVVLRSSLANVHARDIMTANPVRIAADTTVADLIDNELRDYHFGSFPLVGTGSKLVGMTTLRRISRVEVDLRATTRLIDIATPMSEVAVGKPDEPVPEILQRMQSSPDGRALILDESGALLGIISPTDVARYVQLSMLRSQGRSMRGR